MTRQRHAPSYRQLMVALLVGGFASWPHASGPGPCRNEQRREGHCHTSPSQTIPANRLARRGGNACPNRKLRPAETGVNSNSRNIPAWRCVMARDHQSRTDSCPDPGSIRSSGLMPVALPQDNRRIRVMDVSPNGEQLAFLPGNFHSILRAPVATFSSPRTTSWAADGMLR
jgi:hypothetical protein